MTAGPRVLIFTGEGKGKTTAALGMAFRASGHGIRTCVIQFVKGDASVGEIVAAAAGPIDIIQTGLGFLPPDNDPRFCQHRQAALEGLHRAAEIFTSGRYGLVILDEVCFAVARGLLEEQQVLDLLRQTPTNTCVVLTGRWASQGLIDLADTVTEMRCVKHGMQNGWPAQKGVER